MQYLSIQRWKLDELCQKMLSYFPCFFRNLFKIESWITLNKNDHFLLNELSCYYQIFDYQVSYDLMKMVVYSRLLVSENVDQSFWDTPIVFIVQFNWFAEISQSKIISLAAIVSTKPITASKIFAPDKERLFESKQRIEHLILDVPSTKLCPIKIRFHNELNDCRPKIFLSAIHKAKPTT